MRPGVALQFPRDYGSHPQFRNEWWYITGWLKGEDGRELGVPDHLLPQPASPRRRRGEPFRATSSCSSLTRPLSDPGSARLLHDQRAARAGFGLAEAQEGRTDVAVEDWSLRRRQRLRRPRSRRAISATRCASSRPGSAAQGARLQPQGPFALAGDYYYSQPHLAVSGSVVIDGKERRVSGRPGWITSGRARRWPRTVGWDWVGINLEGGGALMAFRMRSKQGGSFWAGGSVRTADGRVRVLKPAEVRFSALRHWRSPRTGAEYPVAMRVEAGPVSLEVEPLMDDQELDARASTGTVYWEGAVRAKGATAAGRGYLELTGYFKPLKL